MAPIYNTQLPPFKEQKIINGNISQEVEKSGVKEDINYLESKKQQ
jgi:hypothetical protein